MIRQNRVIPLSEIEIASLERITQEEDSSEMCTICAGEIKNSETLISNMILK
jgi:hypothetical protein